MKLKRSFSFLAFSVLSLSAWLPMSAQAAFDFNATVVEMTYSGNTYDTLDLRGPAGEPPVPLPVTGKVDGAIYNVRETDQVVGTGVIDPFLRLQSNVMEQGLSVNAGSLDDFQFDEKFPSGTGDPNDGYTHSLVLGDLITNDNFVYIDDGSGNAGEWYFELILDVNEAASINKSEILMTELQLFLADSGARTEHSEKVKGKTISWVEGLDYNELTETLENRDASGALTTDQPEKRYDLDGSADHAVLMDYNNFSGSGNGVDLFVLVPTANFDVLNPNDPISQDLLAKHIILYSKFDRAYSPDAGFEEWALKTTGTFTPNDQPPGIIPPNAVSEPGALALFGIGITALLGGMRRRCPAV